MSTQRSFGAAARKMRAFRRRVQGIGADGAVVVGEEIMTDVKAAVPGRGVPVDEGTLRGSGTVEGPAQGRVVLAFGGAAAPYALVQHERTDFHHDIGEARYLVRGLERWDVNGSQVMAALEANAEAAIRWASRA